MTDLLILGLPRSGTTWVAEVLSSADGTDYVHEPDNERLHIAAVWAKDGMGRFPFVPKDHDQDAPYGDLWRKAFRSTIGLPGLAIDRRFRGSPLAEQAAQGFAPRPLLLLSRTADAIRRRRYTPNRIVKSVHGVGSAEFAQACAVCKVLIIRRDPLNVIASWVDMSLPDATRNHFRPNSSEPFPSRPQHGKLAQAVWTYAYLQMALDRAVDRNSDWHVVSHERLLKSPKRQFAKLAEEVGVPWGDANMRYLLGSNAVGDGYRTVRSWKGLEERWKKTFSEVEADRIRRQLHRYGQGLSVDEA